MKTLKPNHPQSRQNITKNILPRVLPAILLAALIQTAISAPPIPAPDSFSTAEDTALAVPAASGVLANDNPNGNAQIEAVLATAPAHGSVSLNPDGSFTFTPAQDYNGADSFTYHARKVVQPIAFAINPALSNSTIFVTVRGSGINQTRSDTSRLAGTATVGVLEPKTAGPFNLIQVTAVNAALIDDIALNYNFGFLIGRADITAAPGAITVSMDAPGPPAAVNGAGQFTQVGNTLAGDGTVHVKTSGLVLGTSEYDKPLNHAAGVSDFTNATIVSDGTTLTLTVPVNFTINGLVIDAATGITADIRIVGTVVSTAPAIDNVAEESAVTTVGFTVTPVNDPPVAVNNSYSATEDVLLTVGGPGVLGNDSDVDGDVLIAVLVNSPTNGLLTLSTNGSFTYQPNTNFNGTDSFTYQASDGLTESGVATVTLTVTPVNDPPVAVAESYIARESAAMTILATTAQSIEDLVPEGSIWKYRYDGQNLGTAWKEWLYNDAAWASGPAQLGFGDPEIVTNIRPGATPNYTTAYFRRAFTVTNLSNTRPGVKLYVKRDDGAAVYLNGVEVYRDAELPAGAAFDTYTTATRPEAEENIFVEVPLNPALLFEGVNVLAAEVHQASPTSSDVRFDARLTRELGAPGVLANDTDIDSPAASLTASLLAPPAHGQIMLLPSGGFTYTPVGGYIGGDSFVYRVSDGATPTGVPVTFLPRGSTWRYLADGSNQGVLWRAVAFDDNLWPSGPAELGYGDAPEGRPEATNIRPDPVGTPVYATYYFRAHFTAPADLTFLADVRGRILRDDAAAIYINGVEVYRDAALPSGALFSDYATGGTPSETDYAEFTIPSSAIVAGDNVVAVEVHQSGPTSSDVSFDFELVGDIVPGAVVSINVLNDDADLDGVSDTWERANGFNYLSAADATTDADSDGRSNRDEFLAGTNPNNPSLNLRTTSVARSGPDFVLSFTGTLAGRIYQLETSPNLIGWTRIGTPITATGPTLTLATPFAPDLRRFHRLRVLYTFP